MKSRIVSLAQVSAVALLAAGIPAAAHAKTVKHKSTAAAASQSEVLRALENATQQIHELQAQVNALKSQVDSQTTQQAQVATQAQEAQQQAAAVTQQVQAVQTQVADATKTAEKASKDVSTESKLVKWAENTGISGRMYFNFSNIDQKSNGVKSPNDGTGFNVKRFYLGIDHKFNDTFSANLTTDISNVVGSTSNGNFAPGTQNLDGRGLYVKKAYLQAKLNPALIIQVGAADLPWIPYEENQYGYRHLENVGVERAGFGTSADWGVHVLGDLAGGILSYQVSFVDGGGYRNVKVTNSVDIEGRVSAKYKGFYAAVGGYTGKRGNDVQGIVTPHTARRFDALVGYKDKLFNVGAEYLWAKNWNNVTTVAEDKAEGYSVYGSVNFMPKWSAFGRYDWIKPNKLTNDNLKDHYFNLGVQYEPVKIVDLAIVYKRDVADNGLIGTTNGTIGGANPVGTLIGGRGTYDEIGLFGQFRF